MCQSFVHKILSSTTRNFHLSQRSRLKRRQRIARRVAQLESLERRELLTSAYTNPFSHLDVSNDAFIAPIDALQVINDLNANGIRPLPAPTTEVEKYIDTSGDGSLAPIDALLVINWLNNPVPFDYVLLGESDRATSTSDSRTIDLGVTAGARNVRLELLRDTDTSDVGATIEDAVTVSLVDVSDPTVHLLPGSSGGPLFELIGDQVSFPAGLVRFDGRFIDIDVSSVTGVDQGQLVVQLINTDGDERSKVRVDVVSNEVDEEGTPIAALESESSIVEAGPAFDVSVLLPQSEVTVVAENVQFDEETGIYQADVRLRSMGVDPLGRNLVLTLPNLPTGVTVRNPSGTTDGTPYFNFEPAIPYGGMNRGARTQPIRIEIDNPGNTYFNFAPEILGRPNSSPTMNVIGDQTVIPGDVLEIPLSADDVDGDPTTFVVYSDEPLPTGSLLGNTITFRPTPDELGTYHFDVVATDGTGESRQSVTLEVVADPDTRTRVTGFVMTSEQQPLSGVRVTLGALEAFTDSTGRFELSTSDPLDSDTLKIHADELTLGAVYPFIAEKLPLVLGHEVYPDALNYIDRPIYLPALDVAGGTQIDPSLTMVVQQEIAPGEMASVTVAAGSLKDQQGNDYTGTLSITEVPPDFTPAALPADIQPDVVVTIQPGEMQFLTPAPLTLPNRAGYAPGTETELFSINPETGDFDVVGKGRVSADGSQIETTEGGIRNSSWHLWGLLFDAFNPPSRNAHNESNSCSDCQKDKTAKSGDDGGTQGAGGDTMIGPPESPYGYHVRPDYQPGANPFSNVQFPSAIDAPFPSFDFNAGNIPGFPAPGSSGSGSTSLPIELAIGQIDLMQTITPLSASPFGNQDPMGGIGSAISGQIGGSGASQGGLNIELSDILASGTQSTTSEVELHGGSQIEYHDLVTYNSLGQDRGLRLTYDSRRADAIRNIFVGFNNVVGVGSRVLYGEVNLMMGGFQGPTEKAPRPDAIDQRKRHYRKVPSGVNDVQVNVPLDLNGVSTGIQKYSATTGLGQAGISGRIPGRSVTDEGEVVHVNTADSPYGAGWGINGLIELFEEADGRVLYVDGSGGEHVYTPAEIRNDGSVLYESPAADFSLFEKLASGRFQQTSKAQTVMLFDANNRIESITDRNGNQTSYEYDALGRLTKVTDPVGLETTLTYENGQLSTITDPANRVTRFDHDDMGNLTRITDPDDTFRTFDYDHRHHLISEVDRRGNVERVQYDDFGKVEKSTRRDNSELVLQPVQGDKDYSHIESTSPNGRRKAAIRRPAPQSTFMDANGNTRTTELNQAGVVTGNFDEEGALPQYVRDGDHLVLLQTDGRGNRTLMQYDDRGNVISIQDEISLAQSQAPQFESLFHEPIHAMESPNRAKLLPFDVDDDGDFDLLSDNGQRIINHGDGSITIDAGDVFGTFQDFQFADLNGDGDQEWIYLGISNLFIYESDGSGGRTELANIDLNVPAGQDAKRLLIDDLDGDGNLDAFVLFVNENRTGNFDHSTGKAFLTGNGDGTFNAPILSTHSHFIGDSNSRAYSLTTGDANNDGITDVFAGWRSSVLAFVHDGSGEFTETASFLDLGISYGVSGIVVRDFNDDGMDDFIASKGRDQVWYATADGDGSFTSRVLITINARNLREMVLGDVTGDGREDILVSTDDQRVAIYQNEGNGLWQFRQNVLTAGDADEFVLNDMDDDGDLDMVIRSTDVDQAMVKLNQGDGTFYQRIAYNFFDNNVPTVDVRLADGNGDGVLDIFGADSRTGNSALTFVPGRGDGSFGEPTRFDVPKDRANSMTLGDVDNDGDVDAICSGAFDVGYVVMTNDGTGSFTVTVDTDNGGSIDNLLLVDLNNDGNLDLVTAEREVLSALGNGDGTFAAFTELDSPSRLFDSLTSGDFNNDGLPDLLITDQSGSEFFLYLGNGDGTFQPFVEVDFFRAGAQDAATFDLNDDGNLDIISVGSDRLTVQHGNGLGGFTTAQNVELNSGFGGATPFETVSVLDIDNDGMVEAIVTDSEKSQMRIFELLPDSTFDTNSTSYRAMQSVRAADFGDIDGDGDQDIALAGLIFDNNNSVVTHLNRTVEQMDCEGACRQEFTYDPVFNQLASAVDEQGRQTLFEIDPTTGNTLSIRRVIDTLDEDAIVDDLLTTFTYNARGQVETVTDPLGRVNRNSYDAFGRLTQVVMAEGTADEAVQQFEYDDAGNVTATTDAENNRSEMTYDGLNRVTSITNALGDDTQLRYDENGNVISVQDRNGNVTRTVYDEMDRPIRAH